MRISVVGLGQARSQIMAVLASKGHKVAGIDINPHFVDKINKNTARVAVLSDSGWNAHSGARWERSVSRMSMGRCQPRDLSKRQLHLGLYVMFNRTLYSFY